MTASDGAPTSAPTSAPITAPDVAHDDGPSPTSMGQSDEDLARSFVLQGNACALPLLDASVDLIVTSPPYFGQRSYTDGGEHYDGQVGAEPTPAAFLDALWACTRDWMRVLKPSGSLWVNLGDKYSQRVAAKVSSHQSGVNPDYPGVQKDWKRDRAAGLARMPYENVMDAQTGFYVPEKSLMGLPWRYALGCIDQLGLILRAEVLWSKPNGLPESVTDRVRRSHEQWFHFVKSPRYYAAVDRIREPAVTADPTNPSFRANGKSSARAKDYAVPPGMSRQSSLDDRGASHPLGTLPGSVWTIPTEPLRTPDDLGVDHFAAFPTEWPRRLILGFSPERVCLTCGEGLRPTSDAVRLNNGEPVTGMAWGRNKASVPHGRRNGFVTVRTSTGERCSCETPQPTRPGVVLDPFGGTGTTALCAEVLGRVGISVDLSHDYSRLATWRTNDPGERARAMRVPKPAPVDPAQLDLLAGAS